MTHADHLSRQDAVLAKALDMLKASPSVLAVSAKGSYIRGDRDAFSDLDLTCFLRDEERTAQTGLHALGWNRPEPVNPLSLRETRALSVRERREA